MSRLALFDLDNTLLDREAAFATWARRFRDAHGLPPEAWSVIESADADGMADRTAFFEQVRSMLGVPTSVEDLVAGYRLDYPACFTVDDETVRAVRLLRAQGWRVGVVTNGPPSQLAKLEVTGLVGEFDAICISAEVGVWKPEVAIFEEAARRCGVPLAGWMVGDSADHDVEGGRAAGLQTVWMDRGRRWSRSDFLPTAVAATIPEAVAVILEGTDNPACDTPPLLRRGRPSS